MRQFPDNYALSIDTLVSVVRKEMAVFYAQTDKQPDRPAGGQHGVIKNIRCIIEVDVMVPFLGMIRYLPASIFYIHDPSGAIS